MLRTFQESLAHVRWHGPIVHVERATAASAAVIRGGLLSGLAPGPRQIFSRCGDVCIRGGVAQGVPVCADAPDHLIQFGCVAKICAPGGRELPIGSRELLEAVRELPGSCRRLSGAAQELAEVAWELPGAIGSCL